MDPLSITVSCIGLLSSIAGLSKQIGKFVGDVRGSRKDMEEVSRELASLTICLEMLHTDCDNPAVRYPESFKENLANMLRNCQGVITEIGDLIRKMSSNNVGRRFQWAVTAKDNMNKLRLRLEAHKGAIDIALDMLQILLIREVKQDTENILDDTQAIREDTSRLPQMQEDVSQIPKFMEEITMLRLQVETLARPETQDNILIQRFLNDTATCADPEYNSTMSVIDGSALQRTENSWSSPPPDSSFEPAPRLYGQIPGSGEELDGENDVRSPKDPMSRDLGPQELVPRRGSEETIYEEEIIQPWSNSAESTNKIERPREVPITAGQISSRVTPRREPSAMPQTLAPVPSHRFPPGGPDLGRDLYTLARRPLEISTLPSGDGLDDVTHFWSVVSKNGDIYAMDNSMGRLWVIQPSNRNRTSYNMTSLLPKYGWKCVRYTVSLFLEDYLLVLGRPVRAIENDSYLDWSLYLLKLSSLEWSKVSFEPSPSIGRLGHTMTAIGRRIYVFGGRGGGALMNGLASFDLGKVLEGQCVWEENLRNGQEGQPPARSYHSMIKFGEKLYLFGGKGNVGEYNDVWSYDPKRNKWSEIYCHGAVPPPRSGHHAVLVEDTMYICGSIGQLHALRIPERRWYCFKSTRNPKPPKSWIPNMAVHQKEIIFINGIISSKPSHPDDENSPATYTLDTTELNFKKNLPPLKKMPHGSGYAIQHK